MALEAHRPEAAIAWFDRMPEAAREIPEVRRRLDRAISHRPWRALARTAGAGDFGHTIR